MLAKENQALVMEALGVFALCFVGGWSVEWSIEGKASVTAVAPLTQGPDQHIKGTEGGFTWDITVPTFTGTGAAVAEEAKLEGTAAWQKLAGNTVVTTTKARSYTEFYEPGGVIRRVDADGATRGQWSQDGDRVCFDYPDDDDHVCLRVAVQGDTGTFTDADGTADVFQILPGNAKNL